MARQAPKAAPAVWAQASVPAAAPVRARAPATAGARTAASGVSEPRGAMMLMVTCRCRLRHGLRRPGSTIAQRSHFRREKQSLYADVRGLCFSRCEPPAHARALRGCDGLGVRGSRRALQSDAVDLELVDASRHEVGGGLRGGDVHARVA